MFKWIMSQLVGVKFGFGLVEVTTILILEEASLIMHTDDLYLEHIAQDHRQTTIMPIEEALIRTIPDLQELLIMKVSIGKYLCLKLV